MDAGSVLHRGRFPIPGRRERLLRLWSGIISVALLLLAAGCARYPDNEPLKQVDPQSGYRGKFMGPPGNAENILFYLTFSGGGTRAAALSYGVLEELRRTEVVIDGRKRRLLGEVDRISSVSGGSFTAGYYGLFGDRIFEEFESRFLKKDIQGALVLRTFFNPVNWFRLVSATFDRSDLAAEYYDEHIFGRGTFGDVAARKGPMILMNATDMTHGLRIGFNQDAFDLICSDLSKFPVARAVAASSAVPIVLSPISIRNYAGTCGYQPPEIREQREPGCEHHGSLSGIAAPAWTFLSVTPSPFFIEPAHFDFICSFTNFLTSSVSNPELGLCARSRIGAVNSASEIPNLFIKSSLGIFDASATPAKVSRPEMASGLKTPV
jgi:hypothetical protein